jgi:hypothetical protein
VVGFQLFRFREENEIIIIAVGNVATTTTRRVAARPNYGFINMGV